MHRAEKASFDFTNTSDPWYQPLIWCAHMANATGQWIQMTFPTPKLIASIVTQGRPIHM